MLNFWELSHHAEKWCFHELINLISLSGGGKHMVCLWTQTKIFKIPRKSWPTLRKTYGKRVCFGTGLQTSFLLDIYQNISLKPIIHPQTKEVLQQLYCFNLHLSGGLFVTVICWNSNYYFVEFVVKCVRDVESHVWYKSSGGWQSWAFSSGCEWGNWRSSPGQTHIFMVLVVKDGLSVLTRWSLGDVATI